ncbi:twin-arginine translocase subunit TatC [Rhodobacterales bacterium HKCCE2091]|nr:twin-arginine translocase subunit TatC [Rhodobacterales bacterium HKCCE2091]
MSHDDQIEDSAAPLIEHLRELRTRLIRSVLAFLVAMIAVFVVAQPLLNFIQQPLLGVLVARGQAPTLFALSPQEEFFTLVRVSVIGGFFLSFPVIGHQLWRFVAPGLYKSEKNAILPFLIASPFLFLAGAAFAHFVVTPMAMNFFIGFADVVPRFFSFVTGAEPPPVSEQTTELQTAFLGSISASTDLALKFIFAFGICFQLPVLLTLLGKVGLVSAEGLGRMRKYAVVGILTMAALLTPPDVISQVILFVVVYGLYEVSIVLVRAVERQREAQLRADGLVDDDV